LAFILSFLYVKGSAHRISKTNTKEEKKLVSQFEFFSSLDGTGVKTSEEQARRVVAIMIENHPQARPQAGLSRAAVVIEAPVEAPYTRYLAFFDNNEEVPEVGPVRSARPYFLDWLDEYGRPLYLHSGGSPEALKLIKEYAVQDVNEFYRGEYFWRSKNRSAPHNLYTSSTAWQKLWNNWPKQLLLTPETSWKYASTSQPLSTSGVNKEIAISYNKDYIVSWRFDSNNKDYVRYINGERYTDKDGSEVRATNILVQSAIIKVLDEEGRLKINTIGSGDAQMVQNGQVVNGFWNKKGMSNRTRFYNKNKEELILLPGKTWVEVVPEGLVTTLTN
jgi:hypothetical protein